MTINLAQYYDRFDAADNYERHLFRAGNVLQSAELNELQSVAFKRLQDATDALFKEGDILTGAEIVVDSDTGFTQLGNGALYLRGCVRGVAPASFTIAVVGLVIVGIYLKDSVVTELQDPDLRDPAVSFRNYQEPGAGRFRVDSSWGYEGDGQEGDFYGIYEVLDGVVVTKKSPPGVDAIAQAIARYDRQSTGGSYISTGMLVSRLADENGSQVFSIADGVARVNGSEIVAQFARRLAYDATPDTRSVLLEPHIVTTATGDDLRVDINHDPIHAIIDVAVTRQLTETLTHGAFSGVLDALSKTPVVQILSVVQDTTTYLQNTDYKLTADKVDWSLTGSEPAAGSSYVVTYQYIDTDFVPTGIDETGFTVPGTITVEVVGAQEVDAELVTGTLVQASYNWAMPRFDRICLNSEGDLITVKGVSHPTVPRVPAVPSGLLSVAVIEQRWSSETRVTNNGIKMVPMNELNAVNGRIDTLFALVAEERLALNLTQRDATAKKGVFADPFVDDDFRDQGIEQTCAIFNGELTLGIEPSVFPQTLATPVALDARAILDDTTIVGDAELVVSQTLRTDAMRVNPYNAFSPIPGVAIINPSVDFWTDVQTNWLTPDTQRFEEETWTNQALRDSWVKRWQDGYGRGWAQTLEKWITMHTVVASDTEIQEVEVTKVGSRYVDLQYLRQIPIRFELSGFGPNETLSQVIFDGQQVAFEEVA